MEGFLNPLDITSHYFASSFLCEFLHPGIEYSLASSRDEPIPMNECGSRHPITTGKT